MYESELEVQGRKFGGRGRTPHSEEAEALDWVQVFTRSPSSELRPGSRGTGVSPPPMAAVLPPPPDLPPPPGGGGCLGILVSAALSFSRTWRS